MAKTPETQADARLREREDAMIYSG